MLLKGIKTVYCIGVILFLSITAYSIDPPASGVEMPQSVIEAAKRSAKSYGSTGLARRMRAIKLEKDNAVKKGEAIPRMSMTIGLPVLMGNYSDVSHIFTPTDFQEHLFGANPTGSMSDYFDEVSYGQFHLEGIVYGPYTAEKTQSYYAYEYGYNWTFPRNSAGFIFSLLESADPDIDFAQYDNDGPDGIPNSGDDDGIVDALVVIHPDGSASGGDDDNIWAHMDLLQVMAGDYYTTDDPKYGGEFIKINSYFVCGAERSDGTYDIIKEIGTFCHEFGHMLGLPDLYDYDGSSSGVGVWCLMSHGGRGATLGDSNRPTHLSAWCKEQLGFVIPIDIVGTETVQIPPIETNPVVYRLWEDQFMGSRYFLLENRRAIGFDAGLEGEGVLIWHCNNDIGFSNFEDHNRLVDLEESRYPGYIDYQFPMPGSYPDQVYPGSDNITSFDDFTLPSANDVFGNPTGVSAEDFAYGPGMDVTVTLTQREILGYTIDHLPGFTLFLKSWEHGFVGTTYPAVSFTTPSQGFLVGAQICANWGIPQQCTIRIFENILENSLIGLRATATGSLPQCYQEIYYEIPLSSALAMSQNQTFVVDVAWGDEYEELIAVNWLPPIAGNTYFSSDGVHYEHWTDKDYPVRAYIQYCYDGDEDGYNDAGSDPARCGELDNCSDVYNPNQYDSDGDGIGDACDFTCGDSNSDGLINILDIVFLINYKYKEGPEPAPLSYSDVNSDELVNILDIVYLINSLYKDGPEPACL